MICRYTKTNIGSKYRSTDLLKLNLIFGSFFEILENELTVAKPPVIIANNSEVVILGKNGLTSSGASDLKEKF